MANAPHLLPSPWTWLTPLTSPWTWLTPLTLPWTWLTPLTPPWTWLSPLAPCHHIEHGCRPSAPLISLNMTDAPEPSPITLNIADALHPPCHHLEHDWRPSPPPPPITLNMADTPHISRWIEHAPPPFHHLEHGWHPYKDTKDTKIVLALAYWRHGAQTKLQCNNIQWKQNKQINQIWCLNIHIKSAERDTV